MTGRLLLIMYQHDKGGYPFCRLDDIKTDQPLLDDIKVLWWLLDGDSNRFLDAAYWRVDRMLWVSPTGLKLGQRVPVPTGCRP